MPVALGGRPWYHSGLARDVSMLPGETTLTRMLCAANSDASPRANPTRPIFAADTCARPLPPTKAPSPVNSTMRPYWLATMDSMTARVQYSAPSSTTPLTASQSCTVSSVNGL